MIREWIIGIADEDISKFEGDVDVMWNITGEKYSRSILF